MDSNNEPLLHQISHLEFKKTLQTGLTPYLYNILTRIPRRCRCLNMIGLTSRVSSSHIIERITQLDRSLQLKIHKCFESKVEFFLHWRITSIVPQCPTPSDITLALSSTEHQCLENSFFAIAKEIFCCFQFTF